MKRLLLILLLVATACAQDRPRSRQPRMAKGRPQDRAAVAALLEEMSKSWNAGDAAAYANGVAETMDFTNAAGTVYSGRKAFLQNLEELFRSSFKGAHADMKVRRIYFVRPRVVIADLDVTITRYRSLPPGLVAKSGQPLRLRLKYILGSEPGGWLIASGQETQLRDAK